MLLSDFKKKYKVENYSKMAPTEFNYGVLKFTIDKYLIEIDYGFENSGTIFGIDIINGNNIYHGDNYGRGIKGALDNINNELSRLL